MLQPEEISGLFFEFIERTSPASRPFIRGAKLIPENDGFFLVLSKEIAGELLIKFGVIDSTIAYFQKDFDYTLKISRLEYDSNLAVPKITEQEIFPITPEKIEFLPETLPDLVNIETPEVSENPEESEIDNAAGVSTEEESSQKNPGAEIPEIEKGVTKKRPTGKVVHGKRPTGDPTAINKLTPKGEFTATGQISSLKVDVKKGGKWTIISFVVTDSSGSVRCKMFLRGDKTDKAKLIKAGQIALLLGKFEFDEYQRENVMSVANLVVTAASERTDTAPLKRVELHLHTAMSAQDGITSIDEYMRRAASWGMSAIAVTDHAVVQAYPDAAKAAKKHGVRVIFGMEANIFDDSVSDYKSRNYNHATILVKNAEGLKNLYKIVSAAHLDYFYRRPKVPKSLLTAHRTGLIIGSACERGEVFQAVLSGTDAAEVANFYDYFEIMPDRNNEFLIRGEQVADIEALHEINKKIIELGGAQNKPVCATSDAHYLDPDTDIMRRVIQANAGFKEASSELYLPTTDEMLSEFSYLGDELCHEVVVDAPNRIAGLCEPIELFPGQTVMPIIDGADRHIYDVSYQNIRAIYGDSLPDFIAARLERELSSIIKHGFSVLYYIAEKVVAKSNEDGYLVGSRGSVGSSLAAFALGITEINPLPPHYVCPICRHSDFEVAEKYHIGVDLPEKICPKCGAKMHADGFDIPFEVFLGIDAGKVPDIDLNFSGEYQPTVHKYVEELFGNEFVFRAGTISSIKERTAVGYVKKFAEETGAELSRAEIDRLAAGITGVKRTTGQHPGGLVIVPKNREIYEFTPIQRPADKEGVATVTTHFDFNSMHDILVKLDLLGHDNPTMLRILQDMTNVDPLCIPIADPETISLFTSTQAIGVHPSEIRKVPTGTLGIPEFGTKFVIGMLTDTRPTTVAELIAISGLSHGTDVWLGNARDLITSKKTTLLEAICTRDDIMLYLAKAGMDLRKAFYIMEAVRKGKGLTAEQEELMREVGTPDWFIASCKKIKYMFPKAHAAAYVVMALRIAYFKVHHKKEYYAAYFTVRAKNSDLILMSGDNSALNRYIDEIEVKGFKATAVEQDMAGLLEMVLEMRARGIRFLPVDLKRSRAFTFIPEADGIRLPFISIPQLGDKAAAALEEAMKGDVFSVEGLKRAAKLSATVIETMRKIGCLGQMPESDQLNLFEGKFF